MSNLVDTLWEALKLECCKNPTDATKTIVFLGEEKFRKAATPLLDSQAAGDAAPFCRVHAEIEKHDGLVLEVGNDCVACSLHERTQLLNILEPFAAPDGSQDSLTVLQNVTERAATRMRDACVNAIKSLRAVPRGAAYNNAVIDAIHKVESLTLDQVEQEK